MDDTQLLAEHILFCAAKDSGGNCYPINIEEKKGNVYKALSLLELYGKTNPYAKGPMPIFTINELGKTFAANGAWSERQRMKDVEEKRHNEQVSILKYNTRITLFVGVLSALATVLTAIITAIIGKLFKQ